MRRQQLTALPMLAHHFGIMPWDIPRLTLDELNEFIGALNKMRGGT